MRGLLIAVCAGFVVLLVLVYVQGHNRRAVPETLVLDKTGGHARESFTSIASRWGTQCNSSLLVCNYCGNSYGQAVSMLLRIWERRTCMIMVETLYQEHLRRQYLTLKAYWIFSYVKMLTRTTRCHFAKTNSSPCKICFRFIASVECALSSRQHRKIARDRYSNWLTARFVTG